MCKVDNKQLPGGIQWLFQLRDGKYDLRGTCVFKKKNKQLVRTNIKQTA